MKATSFVVRSVAVIRIQVVIGLDNINVGEEKGPGREETIARDSFPRGPQISAKAAPVGAPCTKTHGPLPECDLIPHLVLRGNIMCYEQVQSSKS